MNMFKILKNISGKLVMGLPQLAAIGGVSVLAIYGSYEADNALVNKERSLRSLSAITSSSAQEGLLRQKDGLLRQKDGLLTSINIKDSLNQVATAEERAAMEAGSPSANNFGLDAVDNIKNVSFGAAAETSATDGLGMGANKALEVTAAGGRAAPASAGAGVNSAAVAAAMGNGAGADAASRPTLASASMARASGNAFNATSGSAGGSSSAAGRGSAASGNASGGSAAAGGATEGYQFSGAMPSGSNAISAINQARRSRFTAGGRDSSVSRARRSFEEKNELKDISKRSADAASNRNRSANEGALAWLAGYENSGGMQIDGLSSASESGGSADFITPTQNQIKGIGDYIPEVDAEAEARDKAHKRLMWMTIALAAAAVVLIALGYFLISKGKLMGVAGGAFVIGGWIVLGALMAYAAVVMGFAIDYLVKYDGVFLPTMALIAGAGAIGGAIWAGLNAMKAGTTGAEAVAKMQGKLTSAAKTVGVMGLTTVGGELINEGMQSDLDANKDTRS